MTTVSLQNLLYLIIKLQFLYTGHFNQTLTRNASNVNETFLDIGRWQFIRYMYGKKSFSLFSMSVHRYRLWHV